MGTDINQLHPIVKKLALQHIEACKKAGIKVVVTSAYRSIEEQNRLYEQGRTKPGPIVTNAKGGQSYHNFRVAYDMAPIIDGKIAWNRIDLFESIGKIGESLGLEWGGRFKSIKDLPHFQYRGGLTLQEFSRGLTLKEEI